MTASQLVPIRFYKDFAKRDWPQLPKTAQDALATFLLDLQQNPSGSTHDQKTDADGQSFYDFSPGYTVYWRFAAHDSHYSQSSSKIEVLAVLKNEISLSRETGDALEGLPVPGEQDRIERIYSRTANLGTLSMWGTLHKSSVTGRLKGWIVDSWTQGGTFPLLQPRLNWVSFPDYSLYRMQLNVDFHSSLFVGPADTEIEPERLIFIRATLRQWEQEARGTE